MVHTMSNEFVGDVVTVVSIAYEKTILPYPLFNRACSHSVHASIINPSISHETGAASSSSLKPPGCIGQSEVLDLSAVIHACPWVRHSSTVLRTISIRFKTLFHFFDMLGFRKLWRLISG